MSDHVGLIHEAARLMRQRAEEAKKQAGPPWRQIFTDSESLTGVGICESHTGESFDACDNCWDIEIHSEPVAEHVASWHPGVALLVADWLELVADAWIDASTVKHYTARQENQRRALALAGAYLGRSDA